MDRACAPVRERSGRQAKRFMRVNSSAGLSAQLQALENAALSQYANGPSFAQAAGQVAGASATQQAEGASNTTVNATSGGQTLTGSFRAFSLVAVGTLGPDGQMQLFPQSQIDSEYASVNQMAQTAYANSLQNFLSLSQQADPTGQVAASSYSDQAHFIGDNGLISTGYDANYALNPSAGVSQKV
jgi:hypothetical protein